VLIILEDAEAKRESLMPRHMELRTQRKSRHRMMGSKRSSIEIHESANPETSKSTRIPY
jgi:hypothetical protein